MQSSQRSTIEATSPHSSLVHVERAGRVGLGVQREEAADHLVGLGQDAFVHALAERGELGDAVLLSRSCAFPPATAPAASAVQRHRVVVAADGSADEICGTLVRRGLRHHRLARRVGVDADLRSSQALYLGKFLAITQYGQIAVL